MYEILAHMLSGHNSWIGKLVIGIRTVLPFAYYTSGTTL